MTVAPPPTLFFVVRNEVPSHQLSCICFDHICSEIPPMDERVALERRKKRGKWSELEESDHCESCLRDFRGSAVMCSSFAVIRISMHYLHCLCLSSLVTLMALQTLTCV